MIAEEQNSQRRKVKLGAIVNDADSDATFLVIEAYDLVRLRASQDINPRFTRIAVEFCDFDCRDSFQFRELDRQFGVRRPPTGVF